LRLYPRSPTCFRTRSPLPCGPRWSRPCARASSRTRRVRSTGSTPWTPMPRWPSESWRTRRLRKPSRRRQHAEPRAETASRHSRLPGPGWSNSSRIPTVRPLRPFRPRPATTWPWQRRSERRPPFRPAGARGHPERRRPGHPLPVCRVRRTAATAPLRRARRTAATPL
ncbi:unnamed protein product, partial [Laminaria digitata]